MLHTELITTDQLRQWSGYERVSDIRRWLDRNRITWLPGKGDEICTTLDWIKESQGVTPGGEFAGF